jgi:hypothetical protein
MRHGGGGSERGDPARRQSEAGGGGERPRGGRKETSAVRSTSGGRLGEDASRSTAEEGAEDAARRWRRAVWLTVGGSTGLELSSGGV